MGMAFLILINMASSPVMPGDLISLFLDNKTVTPKLRARCQLHSIRRYTFPYFQILKAK
jgi:hypothetical protein